MEHEPRSSSRRSRRTFVCDAAHAAAGLIFVAQFPRRAVGEETHSSLVANSTREVVFNGRRMGTTWFHPRPCAIPSDKSPRVLMTMQSISGSDVFGPVHWTTTDDLGKTWSAPQPIPGLGRRSIGNGWEEGVCDVVPEYHAKTASVLAIGHNVYYEDGILARPQRQRWPVYVVRSAGGDWSEPQKLEWNDPRGAAIYTCGCSQRVVLPSGDVLIPVSFGTEGQPRSVTTFRCSFDGRTLAVLSIGNELKNNAGRGLLEPSLTRFHDRFYLTIRAEDGRGYVAVSDDGLKWSPSTPWRWDDGEPLDMSTTQQHWLPHSEALFLVYTRKAANNERVMRWRAPLFMSEVDEKNLRLIRASERIVLPLVGDGVKDPQHVARMGNFHTLAVTPSESWVTVGETLPEDDWRGDTLLARVEWSRANELVS